MIMDSVKAQDREGGAPAAARTRRATRPVFGDRAMIEAP